MIFKNYRLLIFQGVAIVAYKNIESARAAIKDFNG